MPHHQPSRTSRRPSRGPVRTRSQVAAAALSLFAGAAAAEPLGLAVFVHDQSPDVIYRLVDLNGDGDCHDPGELTVFIDDADPLLGIDNAQGLVALGPSEILATDNFEPDNILRLRDLNNDGDALDPGEATVFFDGVVAPGVTLVNPTDLFMADDGSFWTTDITVGVNPPPASFVYRLEDTTMDGDANDAGELTPFFELAPAGSGGPAIFDVVTDADDNVYVFDLSDPNQIESIDIIDASGTARTEWLGSDTLFALTNTYLFGGTYELEIDEAAGFVFFSPDRFAAGAPTALMAAFDANNSGDINSASELVVYFDETLSAEGLSIGSFRDFKRLPDGSFVATDAGRDRVYLLRRVNGDFDFNDAGEIRVIYDSDIAELNGLPRLILPLSVDAAALPVACSPADVTTTGLPNGAPDGVVDLSDFSFYLTLWAADDPAADLTSDGVCDPNAPDSVVTLSDFSCYLSLWSAGCPSRAARPGSASVRAGGWVAGRFRILLSPMGTARRIGPDGRSRLIFGLAYARSPGRPPGLR